MLVRNLSAEFSRRGHVCQVAYISDAASLGASEEFERGYREELGAAGISCVQVARGGGKNSPSSILRFRRLVREFRPDILHVHVGHGLLLRAAALLNLPTIYTHHNIRQTFPPALFLLFDRVISRYVAICGPAADLLKRHSSRPVRLIHNGVPVDFAHARERTHVPRDVHVLSVGNLRPEKDHVALIEAAARLVPEFRGQSKTISFSIAGDGPERPRLEKAIAASGLSDHVRLLGTRSDVAALMSQADLLAQPSRSEGLPITLIEAGMSGLPMVASDVGGCSEVVVEGKNGLLVPPARPDLLAEAIAHCLSDNDRYSALSSEAKRLSSRFSIDTCATAHLDLYLDVLAGAEASGRP